MVKYSSLDRPPLLQFIFASHILFTHLSLFIYVSNPQSVPFLIVITTLTLALHHIMEGLFKTYALSFLSHNIPKDNIRPEGHYFNDTSTIFEYLFYFKTHFYGIFFSQRLQ